MALLRRRKRANPDDLWRHCSVFGNCPSDIKRKYEQTTPADQILKYGGSVVYFGGLGIGTGRGGGGTVPGTGTAGINLGREILTARPSLPADTVGPAEVLPTDPVVPPPRQPGFGGDFSGGRTPLDPIGGGARPRPRPRPENPAVGYDDSVIVELGEGEPPEISQFPARGPTEVIVTEGEPAIIEVHPVPGTAASRPQYTNTDFEVSLFSQLGAGETSAADEIHVLSGSGGTIVGTEEEAIPLLDLVSTPRSSEFSLGEQETGFMTSTPETEPLLPRPRIRPYSRRYAQVRVTDPDFLQRPRTLVTTFENPVYDADITQIFEEDVDTAARAAQGEFADTVRLSRPQYSRRPGGGLRVSRIGAKSTLKTRSGVQIGAQTHYYFDISSIPEEIEMQTLGEPLSSATVTGGDTEGFELVNLNEAVDPVPDEDLLDEMETAIGDNLLLEVGTNEYNERYEVTHPNYDLSYNTGPIYNPGAGITIDYPVGPPIAPAGTGRGKSPFVPVTPGKEVTPWIRIDPYTHSIYYDYEPSLRRRRRKKKKHDL
ncbi:L2 [Tadarida brasiliensis papillomavirus 2]|nr:L2 [Tadarida brasiliensis papillomavirus 2]